ncbi:hypothetical protein [Paenibacillus macquariensis]|uniref:Cellobiose phosphorylase n=1 Tax=Paenibacillus macquariensis TaxID=948756 RepID=A0ABY1JK68_9BACL|nr:hypothetical protein [Paenibacillus macquariensis]MEC0089856.1 hypothetical protein [Paenibacillus macquariensis]OAB30680.1 hypothetical protein PMSM_21280 [Paenibacillus macquariensis subsp. macquariensis]SIQ32744.1 hypothetical protein SAMN05421578_101236 [Paenibacillus macquariensis]
MEAYYNCVSCMNRRVRILTVDGNRHEGVITGVDNRYVYLRTDSPRNQVHTSAFYPGRNQILTLSLFTLLAIALI